VYNIFISILVGIALFGLSMLSPLMHWGFALFIAFVGLFATAMLLTRKTMKNIQPVFMQAQKQAQARQFQLAIKTLESLRPLAKWQLLLGSQIDSQIGVFLYADRKEEDAVAHLQKGSARSADSQMILASIYYRRSDLAKMKEVMDVTLKFNKKNPLVYNAYAFMLFNKEDGPGAMAILSRGLKAVPGNEATQENLTKVQNGKKLSMKAFGMNWYSLQLEKPPMSMMQDQFSGRAGFRQQKKRK
jgi:hypothetical protein